MFGAPEWVGTVALMAGIAAVVAFGNNAVERLFRDVSYLLYGVYALFIVARPDPLWRPDAGRICGAPADRRLGAQRRSPMSATTSSARSVILPVLRHLTSDRDAIVSGVIAGPLAMIPALLFFIPMVAFYPEVAERDACRPTICSSGSASRLSTCCSRR